ncbi:type I-C CRISPR-associated protein Cas8c/Csd1 [Comamonas sp. NLF-1-9]|uniref:type I-C CRISPR-associated protein Cas8c/Csd1 n=1 Tax=Comamonas sp. NLF-1-9 TaxID=2853163 RepID=UPI001C4636CE|nr:type I-C CRISPR-associated protein Cas8c/Csd1 [Comamonas sp. NLF-1-9]QXL83984.1 type I-C CRISPR-associated protein Cas8c/Csd1 [Comamonas sp. NLF-1-9]
MSWLPKLLATYDACKGKEPQGSTPLMPICHSTQNAQIEIVLDGAGHFRRASVLEKAQGLTLIPCTEASGGRSGKKPINHPLHDKLQYLAQDFTSWGGEVTVGFANDPAEPYRDYVKSLSDWAAADPHPKLLAVRAYVQGGNVVADLIQAGILPVGDDGKLLKVWSADKASAPAIFKVLAPQQSPDDAFVRWRVEVGDDPNSAPWTDEALLASWIAYYQHRQKNVGLCMATGQQATLAVQHPAKLRHGGDKAKLISANDSSGYTYRGRFISDEEALSIGFVATQKAHNALRWLIERQGYRNGDQVFVAWEPTGKPIPDPLLATYEAFGGASLDWALGISHADAGQAFGLQLRKAIAGYAAQLAPRDEVVVLGLDSATPGRMAITFYRELKGSEFLARLQAWHGQFAWPQNYGKERQFIGAPAPRDIAEAAFGSRLDDKLRASTVERLLPCIVDGVPLPLDLLRSAVRRVANRVGMEVWEWERCLGIACALFKGFFNERGYLMALEQERTSRDYLFGRLLAVAEDIESYALYAAGEKARDTSAARLMQRFADRPASTWRTIELSLRPYIARLRAMRPGVLHKKESLLDDIVALFDPQDFLTDTPLSGEFLLGYHCQRQALRSRGESSDDASETTPTAMTGEPA